MSSKTWTLLILAAAVLGAGAAGAAPQIEAKAPISMELQDAGAVEVFQSFAEVLSAQLVLAPEVRGAVTVSLQGVLLSEAIDAVCAQVGCRWFLSVGPPARLIVLPADDGLWKPLTMQLEGAGIREVLASFARLQGWAVRIDPAVEGKVSVSLDGVPFIQALDAVCRQAGCTWRVVGEGVPRLEISPLGGPAEGGGVDPQPGGAAHVRELAPLGEVVMAGAVPAGEQLARGPSPVALSMVLRPPGPAAAVEGGARLSWSHPSAVLRAAGDEVWEALLAWVPLGEERSAMVPLLLHCGEGGAAPETFAFDPLSLPLDESWRGTAGGATLEVHPSPAPAEPVPHRPRSTAPDLSCDAGSSVEVAVAREGKSLFRYAAVGTGRPLQILLPPTTGRPASYPEVVVLLLGRAATGKTDVGLLTAGEGNHIEMQRFALQPGVPRQETVHLADGTGLQLELSVPE